MRQSEAEPWERLDSESAKAFAAFCLFRDMGPKRTLNEASRRYHSKASGVQDKDNQGTDKPRYRQKSGLMRLWYEKFDWRQRALAWDGEMERRQREATAEARLEMTRRHVLQAKALQSKAIERLAQIDPATLEANDVLAFIVQATRLERTALGEPETVAEQRVTGKDDGPVRQVVVYIPDNGRDPTQVKPVAVAGLSDEAPADDESRQEQKP